MVRSCYWIFLSWFRSADGQKYILTSFNFMYEQIPLQILFYSIIIFNSSTEVRALKLVSSFSINIKFKMHLKSFNSTRSAECRKLLLDLLENQIHKCIQTWTSAMHNPLFHWARDLLESCSGFDLFIWKRMKMYENGNRDRINVTRGFCLNNMNVYAFFLYLFSQLFWCASGLTTIIHELLECHVYDEKDLIYIFFFPGTIRSLHHSQHSSAMCRMRFPSVHVIDAAAKLSHFFHTFHELLCSKLLQEKVDRDKKDWLKSLNFIRFSFWFTVAFLHYSSVLSLEILWKVN